MQMQKQIANAMVTKIKITEAGKNAKQLETLMASLGATLIKAFVVTNREQGAIHGVSKLALVMNKQIQQVSIESACFFSDI